MYFVKKFIGIVLTIVVAVSGLTICADAAAFSGTSKLTSLTNSISGITVKWSKNKKADSYKVFRKSGKGALKKIATVKGGTNLSYVDKKAKSGVKYTYAVKAYKGKSAGAMSKTKSIVRVGTPKVTLSNKLAGINVSWGKVAGATKYAVSMRQSGKKKFKLAYYGKNTSYIYDVAKSNVSYEFKVKAVIGKTTGAYTTLQKKCFLDPPKNFHAEEYQDDLSGITIDWNGVKGADGYYIYRSLKKKDDYKRIANVKAEGKDYFVYVDKTCVSINSYKYYAVAYKGADKSAKSEISADVYGYLENEDTPLYLTISKGEVYTDIYDKVHKYGADNSISWSSNNSKIVSVSSVGVMTGVNKGTAKITAKGMYENKIRKVHIYVTVK